MPFAALGELDSVFTNEQQIDDLLTLVQSFGKQPIMATQY
jgi:type I restriction enzyme R subunit